jgi:hypothetical protein
LTLEKSVFPKDWTVSEKVAIGRAIEEELKAQGERRGNPDFKNTPIPQSFVELQGKESAEIAAEKAGFNNKETYRQAKTITEDAILFCWAGLRIWLRFYP